MAKVFETYRGFVYPWMIDHVGHMNVQFYVGRFDEASWHFLARLGFGPARLKDTQRAFVGGEQQIEYKREVKSGTLIHVVTELLEIKRKTVRYVHRMYDTEADQLVASMNLLAIYFDTEARKSAELPQSALDRGAEILAG